MLFQRQRRPFDRGRREVFVPKMWIGAFHRLRLHGCTSHRALAYPTLRSLARRGVPAGVRARP